MGGVVSEVEQWRREGEKRKVEKRGGKEDGEVRKGVNPPRSLYESRKRTGSVRFAAPSP